QQIFAPSLVAALCPVISDLRRLTAPVFLFLPFHGGGVCVVLFFPTSGAAAPAPRGPLVTPPTLNSSLEQHGRIPPFRQPDDAPLGVSLYLWRRAGRETGRRAEWGDLLHAPPRGPPCVLESVGAPVGVEGTGFPSSRRSPLSASSRSARIPPTVRVARPIGR